tara:strand:+ start:12742 stop:18177 length:5436 start_codon:yes stop_codon:yes gene_type:complete
MAMQNTSSGGSLSFSKKMSKDVSGMLKEANTWISARNATNNTDSGDLGELSNEESNILCAKAPYTIIGNIHLGSDEWAVFSTDNTNCEIGLFKENDCSYTKIVNDSCLSFNKDNLITGVGRTAFDCGKQVYWDDGVNPTRVLDIDDIPWIQDCNTDTEGCVFCTDTENLNCEKIRLAPLVDNICLRVELGQTSGELINGNYAVVGRYLINGVPVGDYSLFSNLQGVFDHINGSGAIDVFIDNIDQGFDNFELWVIQFANFNTTISLYGEYSTRTNKITIDQLGESSKVTIETIKDLTKLNRIADTSQGVFRNGKYLLRISPTDKFDFNYQPLANQIETKWISVEYPANYYREGGSNTGYMRDEVYSFFIRWVYNTGDKSASYHIPGRYDTLDDNSLVINDDVLSFETDPKKWKIYNTASVDIPFAQTGDVLPDGGTILGGGNMGYWESTEKYDDKTPDIWNASSNSIWGSNSPAHDLCGRAIRHHKFPDNGTDEITGDIITNHYDPNTGEKIRIMGVQFNNVKPPLNNDGTPITNIVSYEILRGTREGNKSVLAKGQINNTREYYNLLNGEDDTFNVEDGTGRQKIYPNYPYNPTTYPDQFLSSSETDNSIVQNTVTNPTAEFPNEGQYFDSDTDKPYPETRVRKDLFTFHSPETNFRNPRLSAKEIKIYGELYGDVDAFFDYPSEHPKHKFITDTAFIVSAIVGIGYAIISTEGKKSVKNVQTKINYGGTYTQIGPASVGSTGLIGPSAAAAGAQVAAASVAAGTDVAVQNTLENSVLTLLQAIVGFDPNITSDSARKTSQNAAGAAGSEGGHQEFDREVSPWAALPDTLRFIQGVPAFLSFWGQGINTTLDIIYAFTPYRQYALQFFSHCFYDRFLSSQIENKRREINDSVYLEPNLQDFTTEFRINNIYRSRTVALKTTKDIANTQVIDNSQITYSQQWGRETDYFWDKQNVSREFKRKASSHYVGLKQPLLAQYGQIANINQVPVSTCDMDISKTTSNVLFNGDVFVGRYTEKNTMHFFYDWLKDQPDGAQFNYKLKKMVTHPRFWMDTDPFDVNEFVSSLGNLFELLGGSAAPPGSFDPLQSTENGDCNCNNNLDAVNCKFIAEGLYTAQDLEDYCEELEEYNQKILYSDYLRAYKDYCDCQDDDGQGCEFPQLGPGSDFDGCIECVTNPPNCNWSEGKWERRINRADNKAAKALKKANKQANKLFDDWLESQGQDEGLLGQIENALVSPGDKYAFDKRKSGALSLTVKDAFMYLFNSGTRDFFVESEINIDLRDWGDENKQRHYDYDRYSNLREIYNVDDIKISNFMKYDYSLSNSKLFSNFISWGTVQDLNYDPVVSETCYVNRPNRIIYSLPQEQLSKGDYWRTFLPLNFKEFISRPITVKQIGNNGAIILFEEESPVQFLGVDKLQLDSGNKITIGDGGLFSQPLQNLVNADRPHEYGSCQNELSVINTPAGLFYMSQNQGKIFQVGNGLTEISNLGMKWWIAKYLPYRLTKDFPNFKLIDNPIIGIGCQSVFDNDNQMCYFSKKDYELRKDIEDVVTYSGKSNIFLVNNRLEVKLGDPRYFNEASWTLSYDPKSKGWISYHDWHQDLSLPTKNTFMTTKDNGIWLHNDNCGDYCNFYGKNHPFEVEFPIHSQTSVETIRNIEYYMEVYTYSLDNCDDRFHVLDFNFDEAVVYNTEQCSGLLQLNLTPKNNAPAILDYPAINPTNIDILFSKEEQKYRFNQFWDITDNRGEFDLDIQRTIFVTEPNGYIKPLNQNNLNYNKFELERKKFRHYKHTVLLRRKVSGNKNMIIAIGVMKKLKSSR